MSLGLMPLGNDFPWYKFTVSLSGTVFTIHCRYNSRMARWIMDINDATDNVVVSGLPLLIERNLTGQYVMSGLPEGLFSAFDFTNQQTQPDRYSFGIDHGLIYEDPTT